MVEMGELAHAFWDFVKQSWVRVALRSFNKLNEFPSLEHKKLKSVGETSKS